MNRILKQSIFLIKPLCLKPNIFGLTFRINKNFSHIVKNKQRGKGMLNTKFRSAKSS